MAETRWVGGPPKKQWRMSPEMAARVASMNALMIEQGGATTTQLRVVTGQSKDVVKATLQQLMLREMVTATPIVGSKKNEYLYTVKE